MTRHEGTKARRHEGKADNDAFAVLLIAAERGVERVACACETAAAAGVRVGMTVAHARSLLAGRRVRVAPHNPEHVERALDRLVQWAFRFTPVVKPDYPDGLLLNITGCAHLYAGEEKLAKEIVWSLEQWRLPARVSVAATATAARAVARYTQQRITVIPDHAASDELRFLPVSALGMEADIRNVLAEVGVINIDQLLNLPREDLAPRFGAALLNKMDQAMGLAHELIQPARQIEPFELTRTFDGAICSQDAVFLAVEQLLRDLVARLARDESGVSRMSITFFRIDDPAFPLAKGGPREVNPNPERQRRVEPPLAGARGSDSIELHPDINLSLSFPSRDFAHLWSLLRPKLECVNLGYGVEEIVLRVLHAQRLPHRQMELWPDSTSATQMDDHAVLGQWLDQIIERLGRNAVIHIQPAQRYLPEEAFTPQIVEKADAFTSSPSNSADGDQRGSSKRGEGQRLRRKSKIKDQRSKEVAYPTGRPSQLFSPPHRARVIALVPDGPPAWISWQGGEMNVVCGYGPERICAPWWDRARQPGNKATRQQEKNDEADISPHHHIATSPYVGESRDYFVIQTDAEQWLWVYRDCASGEWFVHGKWN